MLRLEPHRGYFVAFPTCPAHALIRFTPKCVAAGQQSKGRSPQEVESALYAASSDGTEVRRLTPVS
jgi:hypothetical protein